MPKVCTVKLDSIFVSDCRKTICRELEARYRYKNDFYCVLHFPYDNKQNETNFNEVVESRINQNLNDFSFVYFPVNNSFKGKNLKGKISFYKATFSDEAQFGQTVFENEVSFIHTNFEVGADFDKAVFKEEVVFNYAEFKDGSGFFRDSKFEKKTKFLHTVFNKWALFHDSGFFKSADFSWAKFNGNAQFDNAVFNDEANFALVSFNKYAYFSNAKFLVGANFVDSTFNDKTFFYKTLFKDSVDFGKVKFSENSQVDFHDTDFRENVYFTKSVIEGYLEFLGEKFNPVFAGEKVQLKLQQARVEKAKRISFRNTLLRPIWFIDVNLKDFIFLDVDWLNADGTSKSTNLELQALVEQKITGRPHRLLNIACSQLSTNYEENKHFDQASNFRRMSMELIFWEKWLSLKVWLLHPLMLFIVKGELRIRKYKLPRQRIYEKWKEKKKIPYSFWQSIEPPHYFYRWLSFYGESWSRAAFVLLMLILVVFPFIYSQTDFYVCSIEKTNPQNASICETRTLSFGESVRQSLATATLQNVESRKPNSPASETFTILEKLFAPLQAALLVLAIRRKFMR